MQINLIKIYLRLKLEWMLTRSRARDTQGLALSGFFSAGKAEAIAEPEVARPGALKINTKLINN